MRPSPIALAITVTTLALTASGQSIVRAPKYELPPNANYEVTADFDLDGKIDAVVRSGAGWYVVHDVGRTPSVGAAIAGGGAQTYLAAGDVTGDGAPDVVARYNALPGGTSGVTVFVGRGDGTFDPPVNLAGPDLTWKLILADVDGDGTQDVVSFDTETVFGVGYVHTANAWFLDGPTPVAAPPLALPTFADTFAAFDLDGDGSDEVAFARSAFEPFPDDLWVVDWNAAGIPSLAQTLEVTTYGGSANGLTGGDFDGDGDDDLVFTQYDSAGDDAFVLENTGGFLVVGPLIDDIGGTPYIGAPLAVDWDGDGDDDLCYLDFSSQFDTAYVYLCEAEGLSLAAASHWSWPGASQPWGIAAVHDLDGDGFLDVIAGSAVMHGRGVFEQVNAPIQTAGCCFGPLASPEDVDGDGDLDLLVGAQYVVTNDGTGKGPSSDYYSIALPGAEVVQSAFARGDFDGDGLEDLLVEWGQIIQIFPFSPQFEFLGTRLLRGQPDGVFVDGGVALAGTAVVAQYGPLLDSADFDGDGDLDVLAINGWHANDGTGHFGPKQAGFVGEPRLIADLNGDGDPDLLMRETFGNSSTWHYHDNDGTGTFTEVQSFVVVYAMGEEPLLFDFDRDGLDDLCFPTIGAPADSGVSVALNLGGGAWAAPQTFLVGEGGYGRLASGDVNGDGLGDLLGWRALQGSLGARLDLWLGTASAGVYERESYFGPGAHRLADLDGDGDDDLIASGLIEATTFDTPSSGFVKQHGFGYAGGPAVPILGAKGPFVPGTPQAELRITHGIGGALYFDYWGLSEVALLDVPVPGAGIFIAPINLIYSGVLSGVPGAPGEGSVTIDKSVWIPLIPGFAIPHQAVLVHPGYPNGWALTNAVTIGYGY